jgi:hypothetical protein
MNLNHWVGPRPVRERGKTPDLCCAFVRESKGKNKEREEERESGSCEAMARFD